MKSLAKRPQHIALCTDCSTPLPIRRAERDEVAATWECLSCGARYRGMLDRSARVELQNNVGRICRG